MKLDGYKHHFFQLSEGRPLTLNSKRLRHKPNIQCSNSIYSVSFWNLNLFWHFELLNRKKWNLIINSFLTLNAKKIHFSLLAIFRRKMLIGIKQAGITQSVILVA
jgi:hypothetical protein